jgi:signal transduction histidine kinase
MIPEQSPPVARISVLRWAVPLAVALIGAGYMLFEQLDLERRGLFAPYLIPSVLFFGLVGPLLAWLTLTWTEKVARAQVEAEAETRRLFEETRRQYQVMRALHDVALDITSRLESQQVLASILEHAARLLKAEASSLAVKAPQTNLVRYIAVHNLPPEFTRLVLPLPEGVSGHVITTGEPFFVNDYRNWQGHSPAFDSSPYDAVIGVPLRWHGEVFGALAVSDRGERRPFNQDDIQLLSLFADLASIALKNAEFYAQVVALGQNLERQVETRTQELCVAREELARNAAQLQKLLNITVHVQEEERSRIARDLHDGSNQLITGALYEIQAARESLAWHRIETAVEKLDTAKILLGKIEAVNRRIIFDLRPPILDALGLVPAIRWYAETYQAQYEIRCFVQVSGQPARFSAGIETAVYRVVQESLNNVAEHARATCAQVHLAFMPHQLTVIVEDDGVGFDPEVVRVGSPGRMGLIGMQERAKSIGSMIQVTSMPGTGTRVRLELPLSDELQTL